MEKFTTIEAYHGKERKKLYISKDMEYTHFLAAMRGMFPKGFDVIKYEDEDKDLITMGSQEEFAEAIKKVAPKIGNKLKVYLKNGEESLKAEAIKTEAATDPNFPALYTMDIKRPPSDDTMPSGFSLVACQENESKNHERPNGKNSFMCYMSLANELAGNGNEKNGITVLPSGEHVYLPPADSSLTFFENAVRVEKPNSSQSIESVKDANTVKQEAQLGCKKAKANKKRKKKQRNDSSGSSCSSTDSDTDGSLSGTSTGSSTSCSSSSSSSSSNTSSSSDTESASDVGKDVKVENDKECAGKKLKERKKRQRKQHEERMFARKLAHYIAPDVCDEVAHCMHHFKKDVKKILVEKIVVTIEDNLKKHANSIMPVSEAADPQNGGAQRERMLHEGITCDGCDQTIFGPRYKCGNCSDYDLCESCEALEGLHDETHAFVKMHRPNINAGRSNGKGKMKPLLRHNIYVNQESLKERKSSTKSDMKSVDEKLNTSVKKLQNACAKQISATKSDIKADETSENLTNTNRETRSATDEKVEQVIINTISVKERVNEVLDQTEPQKATPCKEIERATSEDITDDEVVVVKREEFSEALQAMKTPDLVELDAESVSSYGSEDFVVLPKCYNFDSGLNDITLERLPNLPRLNGISSEVKESVEQRMTVDLLDGTSGHSSPQPVDSVPDVTNADKNAISGEVIEKQPDLNLNLASQALITKQPEQAALPAKDAVSPMLPPNQGGEDLGASKVPDPVKKQPSLQETRQPEPLVIFGRGPTDQIEEPAKFFMRTRAVVNDAAENKVEVSQSPSKHNTDASKDEKNAGDKIQNTFNRPSDKFLQQQKDYNNATVKRPPSWSPESLPGSNKAEGDVFLSGDLFTEAISGLVDATTTAATAVYEGLSTAMNSRNDKTYSDNQNNILTPPQEDLIDGVPRPLQTPESPEQGFRNQPTAPEEGTMHQHTAPTPRLAFSANDMLYDMGFYDRARNARLLRKHDGNVNLCVAELLADNNWHYNRH